MKKSREKLVLVFSDIEMGAGGVTDDFPQSDHLGRLLLSYNEGDFAGIDIDLVFNGDTFDFLKTVYKGKHTHHVDRDVATEKMTQIAAAHAGFFESLREFLVYKKAQRNIYFIVGNHDMEILFPEVQDLIYDLCGTRNRVYFPGFEIDFGDVHIEHGSQRDVLFRMDSSKPFLRHENKTLLNMPWAVVPLIDVVLPLQSTLYHLDRIKPRQLLMQILPEMNEWLTDVFWKYWTQDFLRDYFRASDPFKKVSWTMLKEILRRFVSGDHDVSMGNYFQTEIQNNSKYNLYLAGHKHESAWWSFGKRKILQTGCFRNEFMIVDFEGSLESIPCVYAEVYLRDERLIRSHLVEIEAFPVPVDYIPRPILDFRPILLDLLGSQSERREHREAIEEQEKIESRRK